MGRPPKAAISSLTTTRGREDEGEYQHHPAETHPQGGVEAHQVSPAARLRPEVVPAPSAVVVAVVCDVVCARHRFLSSRLRLRTRAMRRPATGQGTRSVPRPTAPE